MNFICNKRIYDLEKVIWTSQGAAIVDKFEFESTKGGYDKITFKWSLTKDLVTKDLVTKDSITTISKNSVTLFKDKIPADASIIPIESGEITILVKLLSDRSNIEKVVFLFNKCDKSTLENVESFIVNNI